MLFSFCYSGGPSAQAAAAPPPAAAASDFDEPAEPLVERGSRKEADADHLHATALFAAARTNEQRQDYPLALRQYERSLRYDPQAQPALREIVALAFNLDRRAEAGRYAQMLVPKDSDDAILLRRLGLDLAENSDWDAALKLYEKVAALPASEKPSANTVLWWMEMGRLYYITKQYAKAAGQFGRVDRALEHPADFGLNETMRKAILGTGDLTYQLFGECYLESGQTAEAQQAFEKSNNLKDNPGLLAFNLARVAASDKQSDEALARLEVYFKQHQTNQGTAPYGLLADVLKKSGRQNQLIPKLEQLHTEDSDNTPLTYFLAEQYRAAGEADKAEPLYRKLCAPGAKRPPVDAYQALVALLHKAGRWDDLLALLGEACGKLGVLEPLGSEGKELLADKAAVGALLAAAAQKKQQAADSAPSGTWLAAALLAVSADQFADADDYFARAVEAGPDKAAELTLTWGLELLTHNQYDDAARVFRRGIDARVLPAENPAFHFYLAGALAMEDKTDEALAEARKAAELQKDSARFASRVGWIQYHAKRYADARASYEELLKRFDGDYDSSEVRDVMHDARLVLSNIEVAEKHFPASEEWLEQLLDEFPSDPGALNDLGYLWADRNLHLHRALRMVDEAIAAEPDNLAYRDSRGWVYYRLGQFDKAVAELEAATATDRSDAVALEHLADALAAKGDTPGALAAWQRAAATFDKDHDEEKSKAVREKIAKAAEKKDR